MARAGPSRLRVLMAAALLLPLSGCAWPTEKENVAFENTRYYWEGELLVLNFTVRNLADFHIGPDDAHSLTQLEGFLYEYRSQAGRPDYVAADFQWVSLNLVGHPSDGGLQPRYYSAAAVDHVIAKRGSAYPYLPRDESPGPVDVPPGGTITLEFVFKPQNNFTGSSGVYSPVLEVFVFDTAKGETEFTYPCFNRDTAPFYGDNPMGPDCHFDNSRGSWYDEGRF